MRLFWPLCRTSASRSTTWWPRATRWSGGGPRKAPTRDP
jgi:hypothetical protein